MSKRYVFFPGRYQPFHNGHRFLIEEGALKKGLPACIAVRDTEQGEGDPYSFEDRKRMIEAAFPDQVESGDVLVDKIPDILGIVTGRKVGYFVESMSVPEDVAGVSATMVRKGIDGGNDLWEQNVAPGTAKILKEIHGV